MFPELHEAIRANQFEQMARAIPPKNTHRSAAMAAFFLNQNVLISCNLKPATPKIKTLRVYCAGK